jgi:hypothetical protein
MSVPADAADGPVGVPAITVEYALALLRETQNPARDATPIEAPPASPISRRRQAVLSCALATSIVGAWPSAAHASRLAEAEASHRLAAWRPWASSVGSFLVEECAARRECKVQPAIRGHYADGGEHQIYGASPGQFAPVIAHDSPPLPRTNIRGALRRYTGGAANFGAVWRGRHT